MKQKEKATIKLGNKMYTRKAVRRYERALIAIGIVSALIGLFFASISIGFLIFTLLITAFTFFIAYAYHTAIKADIKQDAERKREADLAIETFERADAEFQELQKELAAQLAEIDAQSDAESEVKEKSNESNKNFRYEKFYVAGTYFRQDNILSLPHINNELYRSSSVKKYEDNSYFLDDKVYQFDFKYYTLNLNVEHEPDNPVNPDAMKVCINDIHVGYIRDEDLDRFDEIANIGVQGVVIDILGGNYKFIDLNDDGDYFVNSGEEQFYIILTFRL